MQILILLVIIAFSGNLCAADVESIMPIVIPGDSNVYYSPMRKFRLIYYEPNSKNSYFGHKIVFLDGRHHAKKVFEYRFDRSIALLWSPDASYVAITDNVCSNFSKVMVISTSARFTPCDTEPALKRDQLAGVYYERPNHRYVQAVRFNSNGCLVVRVTGHDDTTGEEFDLVRELELNKLFPVEK